MTEEKADELIAEIAKLTDNKHLKIEPADLRFVSNPTEDTVWEINTSAGSSFEFQIWGKTKAEVATSYIDHLIHVYRHALGRLVPTKPKFGERRDPARDLKMSLILASLSVLREEYLGT